MAANIEIRNGVASFAENSLKGRAWHRLGEGQQIFDRPMFVDEALKACHADYTVQTQPVAVLTDEIRAAIANGDSIPASMLEDLIVPNKMATVRTDLNRSLGVVSDSYGIVQNADAFRFVDMFCSGQFADRNNTPVIETCGVLGRGERVFVTAKFPEKVVLDAGRDDVLDMYVVFTTSHDGTGCVKCMVTPVRVVCNNTLNLAMSNNIGRIAFRHSSNVMNRLDLLNKENAEWAYKTLNVYETYTNCLKQDLEHLRNIRISEKDLDNILADVLLSPEAAKAFHESGSIYADGIKTRGRNIFLNVKNAMETGVGQHGQETGTALWALNGLTTYYQNEANYSNEEIKFDSLLSGNAYNKVQQFHEALLATA
jgi:phage/plasmid-like protein (TIGR03299 family)